METFNFGPHTVRHGFPDGDQVSFGGGYQFAAAPILPLQRRFYLRFESLCWFRNGAGVLDVTVDPTRNVLALNNFYAEHTLYKRFTYVHEAFGSLTVRFMKAFEMPAGRPGGSGWTEPFDLTFIEVA